MTKKLSLLVSEQKDKLTKKDSDIKKLLAERQSEEARRTQDQVKEDTQKAKVTHLAGRVSELKAQVSAQESIINGLREERKLWSQELAHQVSSALLFQRPLSLPSVNRVLA